MPQTSIAAGSEFWTDDTLTALLDRCVRDRGDRPAILTADETVDYRTLSERIDALAGGLVALGIGGGRRDSGPAPQPAGLPLHDPRRFPYRGGDQHHSHALRTARGRRCDPPRRRQSGVRGGGGRASGDRRKNSWGSEGDLPSLAHVVAVGGEVPDGALAFDDVARPGVPLPLAARRRRPLCHALHLGHLVEPQGGPDRLSPVPRQRPSQLQRKADGTGFDHAVGRAVYPPVRALLLPTSRSTGAAQRPCCRRSARRRWSRRSGASGRVTSSPRPPISPRAWRRVCSTEKRSLRSTIASSRAPRPRPRSTGGRRRSSRTAASRSSGE